MKPLIDRLRLKHTLVDVIGIVIAITYIIVFIGMWLLWNVNGHEVVKFTEANPLIKYTEWFIGIVGMAILVNMFRHKIDSLFPRSYDPPV